MTAPRPPQQLILCLVYQEAGQVRRVPVQRPLRIGRDRSCDIVLSDAQASRQHCVVTPRPDGLLVDASASTNGVVGPNGQTRTLFVPPNGAFIIGHTRFEVRLATPAEVAGIGQQRAGTSHGAAMPGMTVGADQPMPYVTYQQAGQPRRVAVDRTLRIGRHPSMDIVVNDPQVSREHCTVTPRADGLAIDASGSTNGVVGPHGQAPALVAPPGGWFVVGGTRFEVGVGTAGELARHTLPPSQRRGVRSRQRGPAPVLLAALGGLAVVAVVVVGIVALGSRGSGGANPAAVTWPPSAGSLDPAMKASVAVTLGHVTPHLPWAVQDASVVSGDGVVYAVQQLPDNIQGQPSVVLVQGQGGNWSAIDETSDSFCQTLMHMHAVGAVKDSLVDYFSGCES